MSTQAPGFRLVANDRGERTLVCSGDWLQGQDPGDVSRLYLELAPTVVDSLTVDGSELGQWDSLLMAFLLSCHDYCREARIGFHLRHMPAQVEKLMSVATAVPPNRSARVGESRWTASFHPRLVLAMLTRQLRDSLAFIGETGIALSRLTRGRANTRFIDFTHFVYQAGPDALGIITLVSVLVGMILAYLGAVQLQQFGAELYVADLVVVGMLREMGVLMTAVVMAGRTGAAYAAQLGTMQTNDEIDAITTMGVSPIEFLVLPRILALVAVMPLLTIYADILGIVGGGLVAITMGISPLQYVNEAETVLTWTHIGVGLIKSIVFGILIAVAGCRAGINSGRSSAAVGQAATSAVVTAIVYLIVADAAINILCQQVDL